MSQIVPIDDLPANPLHAKGERLTLQWTDLCFEVPEATKKILKNVSGVLRPGEVTAIMGPSGAGKSTLMNVLAGRAPYGNMLGTVSLNGAAIDPLQYRKKVAYVMQQDALFATQTPRECLRFTAALKLPNTSASEREELVERSISSLSLQRCADTMIGSVMMPGLSGGEKKRTAVAVELISSPSLIFLDEPTSGLDSHSAAELIKLLRGLAEQGCTIICTIHQPSSEVFDLFHRVMFLRLGQMVYNGAIDGIVPYFAARNHHCKPNYNPADFAMRKLQTLSDEEIEPLLQKEPQQEAHDDNKAVDMMRNPTASFHVQVAHLLRREFHQFIRDKMTLGARFGMSVLLALMTGIVFQGAGNRWGNDDGTEVMKEVNNHWGALVFFTLNAMFLSAQPLLLVFPIERAVFIREYAVGTYSTSAYFIAKTMVEIPSSFVQQAVSALVCYYMVDMQGNYLYLVLSLTLLSAVSASTALLLGAATTRAEAAVNLVPAIYVPQILFAGFFVSADAIPVFMRWIQWVCPLKYSIGLATIIEFAESAVPSNNSAAVNVTNRLIYNSDVSRDSWGTYVLIMVGIFFAFRSAAAVTLSRRARKFK